MANLLSKETHDPHTDDDDVVNAVGRKEINNERRTGDEAKKEQTNVTLL